MNGPPAVSSVSGVVTSRGARLAVPTFVEALEDINADIALQNGTANLQLTQNSKQVAKFSFRAH